MDISDYFSNHLAACAHMVLGAKSWERAPDDPAVVRTIENAQALLSALPSEVGTPDVHPGLTSDPETVVSLEWKGRGFASLCIHFNRAGLCHLSWTGDARGLEEPEERPDLPIGVLMVLDVAGKISDMRNRSGWNP